MALLHSNNFLDSNSSNKNLKPQITIIFAFLRSLSLPSNYRPCRTIRSDTIYSKPKHDFPCSLRSVEVHHRRCVEFEVKIRSCVKVDLFWAAVVALDHYFVFAESVYHHRKEDDHDDDVYVFLQGCFSGDYDDFGLRAGRNFSRFARKISTIDSKSNSPSQGSTCHYDDYSAPFFTHCWHFFPQKRGHSIAPSTQHFYSSADSITRIRQKSHPKRPLLDSWSFIMIADGVSLR